MITESLHQSHYQRARIHKTSSGKSLLHNPIVKGSEVQSLHTSWIPSYEAVQNRGNEDRRLLEVFRVVLTKPVGPFTSPFHTSGRVYSLLFYNRLLQISGKLVQLHLNQFLDGLKHFGKPMHLISEPSRTTSEEVLSTLIRILKCQNGWEWLTLDRGVVVSLNPAI